MGLTPVVLIGGYLCSSRLEKASQELEKLTKSGLKEAALIIDSHGGDIQPVVEFEEKLLRLPLRFNVKIYEATSAAAFLVLVLVNGRAWVEMDKSIALEFHRGSLRLDAADILPDGRIEEKLHSYMKRYNDRLFELLLERGLGGPKPLAELWGSGWLKVPAKECLRLGLVHALF
ncbi:MAG: hypothetical protein WD889_03280 [Candidatus Colwellbacteria bacterium]